MEFRGIYVVRQAITNPGAITLLQIKAGTSNPLKILRAWVSQTASTTSTQLAVQLVRKSGAATVTSFTPLLLRPSDPAANAAGGTSATGYTATGEGTDGDLLIEDSFNILNGWLYLPVPEERIVVPVSGMIGLKFPIAGGNNSFKCGIIFGELG